MRRIAVGFLGMMLMIGAVGCADTATDDAGTATDTTTDTDAAVDAGADATGTTTEEGAAETP